MSKVTGQSPHGSRMNSPLVAAPHTRTIPQLYADLGTTPTGLTQPEAAARLAQYGPNELQAEPYVSAWKLLLAQFSNVLIIILLVATALSAVLGHAVEAVAITAIVLFAVLLGYVQEFRAERALEALRQMVSPTATVLRDGEEREVAAHDLVPGDVILLRAGNHVPADTRLLEAFNLQVQEAPLTGESVAVTKDTETLTEGALAVGDRHNMAFAGTTVTAGRGRALIVATGATTELGRISQMLQAVQTTKTPLQVDLDKLGRQLARATLLMVALIVALGVMRGQPFIEMLVFGIALAVAVVPEALPAVVTISLALGVQRLAKRRALTRRLPAVETLGSTSVICSDKTGTLTRDEMTVRRLIVDGERFDVTGSGYEPVGAIEQNGSGVELSPGLRELLLGAALCADAHATRDADGHWQIHGDPTEGALIVAAAKAGLHKPELDARYPRLDEIPFDSESKRMTTLHEIDGAPIAYAKGAPEVILGACSSQLTGQGSVPITDDARAAISTTAQTMANEALRVIAVARRNDATRANMHEELTFVGLAGMIDPPRPESRAAIEACERAGIRVVMITGDHPSTAAALARELGLLAAGGRVITGAELDGLDDEAFAGQVESIAVYARVSPAHKLRVVEAMQAQRHVVAMTGDGVNDAPALKRADIGVAMGITGTDVAKEAAAMTLTDDNFASIVAAVEEGRGIFGNIKKYLMFLLSSNVGEIGLMAGATLLGTPLPLTAVQILYVNLATDGLPALALAVDPPESDLMQRQPRDPRAGIFTPAVVALMLIGGIWSALANLGLFLWALQSGRPLDESMTMTFTSLVLIQFLKAYNFRSDRLSLWQRPLANRWLNRAVLWELALLIAIVYVPFLHEPFGTFALPLSDCVIVFAVALTIVPALETGKWLVRRGVFGVAS